MKRTGIGLLLAAAALGLIVGFGTDQLLTAAGRATFTPSILLPILLVMLGVSVVLMALPIRRAITGAATGRIDPFRAVRVAMLAKASSVVGAAMTGLALGLLVFLLTRPVTPSLGSMGAVIAAIAGGMALLAGGLIAEYLCTIRKDDDDDRPEPPEPGFGLSHDG